MFSVTAGPDEVLNYFQTSMYNKSTYKLLIAYANDMLIGMWLMTTIFIYQIGSTYSMYEEMTQ